MKSKFILTALFLASTTALFAQQKNLKTGNDKDSHGCIASAGYVYSDIKKDCIKTFEQKIQLKEIASKGNYSAAVLFSKDQSKVEIFLKEEKKSLILTQSSKGIWKNGSYTLTQNKGYVLSKNKKEMYKS